jgi:hypothetical protein
MILSSDICCANCLFSSKGEEYIEYPFLACKRYPPVEEKFPKVHETNRCGEFINEKYWDEYYGAKRF